VFEWKGEEERRKACTFILFYTKVQVVVERWCGHMVVGADCHIKNM